MSAHGPTLRVLARLALAAGAIGVFLPWTNAGPVRLDGLHGPNNGWLIVTVAVLALCWTPSMARGSLLGSVAVFGSAVVMGSTAVNDWADGRRVLDAKAAYGLVIVVAASVLLASVAAVQIPRPRRGRHPSRTS